MQLTPFFNRLLNLLAISGLSIALVFGAGCTSRDQAVLETHPNLRSKPDCRGLNLADKPIDRQTLHHVLKCLNTDGELRSLVSWMGEATDEEIAPFVGTLRLWVEQPASKRAQLGSAWRDSEPLLESVEGLLKNESWWSATFDLIAELRKTFPILTPETFRRLREELTVEDWAILGQFVSQWIESESFKEFAGLDLKETQSWSRGIHSHVVESVHREAVASVGEVLKLIGHGEGFAFLDRVFGESVDDVRKSISEVENVFGYFFQKNGVAFDKLGYNAFRLNRPLPCFQGAKAIESGALAAFNELAQNAEPGRFEKFITRDLPLNIIALESFCRVDDAARQLHTLGLDLLQEGLIFPAGKILRGASNRDLEVFVRFISDRGVDGRGRTRHLIPLWTDLHASQFWKPFLLNLVIADRSVRPSLQRLSRILGDEWIEPPIGGKIQLQRETLERWLKETARWIQSEKKNPKSWIENLAFGLGLISKKESLGVLLQALILSLEKQPRWLDSVGRKDFSPVLSWIRESLRAKTLFPLVESLFNLLAATKQRLPMMEAMPWENRLRHRLTTKNLEPLQLKPNPIAKTPCTDLVDRFAFDRYAEKDFSLKLDAYFRCLNGHGRFDDFEAFMKTLTNTSKVRGQSAYAFLWRSFERIGHSTELKELQFVLDSWMRSVKDGTYYQFLHRFSNFIGSHAYSSQLYPLLVLNEKILLPHPEIVKRFSNTIARALRSGDFHFALNDFLSISKEDPYPLATQAGVVLPTAGLVPWIKAIEGVTSPSAIAVRQNEIENDFRLGLNNSDWISNQLRRSWTWFEFNGALTPIFNRIFRLKNRFRTSLVDSFFNVLNVDPDLLYDWVELRSNHPRPIAYFHPGEKFPRTRWVNSLDQLELILINADFEFIDGKNRALKFTQMIGEAWGDEPRALWPAEIQKRFGPGKRPPTLREVFDEIVDSQCFYERWGGYPELPAFWKGMIPGIRSHCAKGHLSLLISEDIQRRVFNIRQNLDVVARNLPGSGDVEAEGFRLIRNLFWELISATPNAFRDDGAGRNNQLSAVVELARLGLLRKVAHVFHKIPNDPATEAARRDVIRSIVKFAAVPGIREGLTRALTEDRAQAMPLTLARKVFSSGLNLEGLFYATAAIGHLRGDVQNRLGEVFSAWVAEGKPWLVFEGGRAWGDALANPEVTENFRKFYTWILKKRENQTDQEFLRDPWSNFIMDVLKEPKDILFPILFQQEVFKDPQALAHWRRLDLSMEGWKDLLAIAARQDLPTFRRALSHWMGADPGDDAALVEFSAWLGREGADRSYQWFSRLGHMLDEGQLKVFFDQVSRYLLIEPGRGFLDSVNE